MREDHPSKSEFGTKSSFIVPRMSVWTHLSWFYLTPLRREEITSNLSSHTGELRLQLNDIEKCKMFSVSIDLMTEGCNRWHRVGEEEQSVK